MTGMQGRCPAFEGLRGAFFKSFPYKLFHSSVETS